MPTRSPLIVRSAVAPGDPARANEDRIFVTNNAVLLLDGATDYEARRYSGAWIAEQAGQRLRDGLVSNPAVDLAKLVESVINDLVNCYQLVPGEAPSTTLAMLRVHGDSVDALVLADSPVILKQRSGDLIEVRDDRLAKISSRYPRPNGKAHRSDPRWVDRYNAIESHRNQHGGFWTISAAPEAANEAVVTSLPSHDFEAALLMSDGASVLKDLYEPEGWGPSFDHFIANPQAAIDRTFRLESEDHDCRKWPRSKRHDDKAIASVTAATA